MFVLNYAKFLLNASYIRLTQKRNDKLVINVTHSKYINVGLKIMFPRLDD